jgi:DNA sulfur modification protein DndE
MEAPLERVRFSQAAKDQLIKLKRTTRIEHWNVLCRWGLCYSLAEPMPTSPIALPADSNLEIAWPILGGSIADLLLIALEQRCIEDGLPTDRETLGIQLRRHLHRGIGYLSANSNIKRIEDLVKLAIK